MSQEFKSTLPQLLESLDGFRVELSEPDERADVILDRPPFNIVAMRQREQLAAVFAELDRAPGVRVIVLRAAGEHFSSGGDIPGFMTASADELSHLARNVCAPERCQKPVIAAIRGYCFGVGLELALACDFRIATESAQLGFPEQRIGMIPGSGGSARLVKMVGVGRAKDMVMRSRRLKAREALDWGLVLSVVAEDALESAVKDLVGELKQFSPLAQRTAKAILNSAQNAPLHVAIETEGQAYGRLRGSEDFREGVESFVGKRKPSYRGI